LIGDAALIDPGLDPASLEDVLIDQTNARSLRHTTRALCTRRSHEEMQTMLWHTREQPASVHIQLLVSGY